MGLGPTSGQRIRPTGVALPSSPDHGTGENLSAQIPALPPSSEQKPLAEQIERAKTWQSSLLRFVERNSALPVPDALEAAAALLSARWRPNELQSVANAASSSPEFSQLHTVLERARELQSRRLKHSS